VDTTPVATTGVVACPACDLGGVASVERAADFRYASLTHRRIHVRCGECGTANDATRRFCLECGARLSAACAACGSPNPPQAKFCGECGTPLTAAEVVPRPAATTSAQASSAQDELDRPRAERRLVSVLFADLVGFTPFSEERDAEEVRETLTAYFDVAREVIERYGGTVEKFIGDAVMAVWGTPVTHEDDPERAVRAAVELVDAVAAMEGDLQARVGVQTGDAAVTLGASGQGMVAGDLVNTTARIQSVAQPGTVLVNEVAMQNASGAIAFEPAGMHELKGKAVAIPLWRALRVVAERGGRGRSDSLEAPFVGREMEFRLLKELFHATGRDRRVRLISISGQAGIGKSRLAWELEKYLDGVVETVWWHHGRSPSYGSGITFWALGEMVRSRCELAEQDDETTTRARVTETVARFVPEDADRGWIVSALLTLLGAEREAAPSEQLFPAWRSFFEHVARQGTTIMVFEDLQWADPGLLAFIDHVVSWSHDLPICIVTLTRPELLEAHPEWGSGQRVTSIPLAPLDRASMQALLTGLVPGLPASARDHIVDRADGIPLHAVETVRMLLNDGRLVLVDGTYRPAGDLTALEVPQSLRALVASRLDTLEPEERSVLQSAAVLGHTFSPEALVAVTNLPADDLKVRLRALVRREMLTLRADPRSPERGQYAFAQEVLREVAYETLARDDRKARHLAAARYFESLEAEELIGALAVQYQAAHRNARPGPEADALGVQARLSLTRAAERAMALGSTEQAHALFGSALELASEPEEEARLLSAAARAAVSAGLGDDARQQLERAIETYRSLGQRSHMARATAALIGSLVSSGWQLHAARTMARAANEDYADLGVDQGLAEILAQDARVEMLLQDDLDAAVATADRALAMAERLDLPALVADLLITRGTALATAGRTLEGVGAIEAGRRLAAAEGLLGLECRALLNMSGPLAGSDPRAMLETSLTAVGLARRIGSRPSASMAVNNVAEGARLTGDWDLALEELRREAERSGGDDLQRVNGAMARLQADRGDDVAAAVEAYVRYCEERLATGEPAWQGELETFLGAIALPAGRYREAATRLRAAAEADQFNAAALSADAAFASVLEGDIEGAQAGLAGMEATGSHGLVVKLEMRRTRAAIAAMEGRADESSAGFRGVLEEYRRLGASFLVAMTAVAMCAMLDPALPEVQAAAEEARAILGDLRSSAWLERLDEVLTRSPVAPSGSEAEADKVRATTRR
jgi:class 3 adenylate cyclase/predicted ATPase